MIEYDAAVEAALHDEVGEDLRAVLVYTADDYEIPFMRDDVEESYDEAEIERAVEELRLETLHKEYLNDVFQRSHGDLVANVMAFTNAVEMNFLIEEGVGVSVAIDHQYFRERDFLVYEFAAILFRQFGEE